MKSNRNVANALCLECGICCDGTLFKDVELQAVDDTARLRQLGLKLKEGTSSRIKSENTTRKNEPSLIHFAQPCAALCGGHQCRIYDERPAHCRNFECALFIAVAVGKLQTSAAQRTIRSARQGAERVRRLLRELGDHDETMALSVRFRRVRRRFETSAISEEAAAIFAQLTLAVHELNLILSEAFYPGSSN